MCIAFYFHDCCAQDMFWWHVKRFVLCVTPLDICGIISNFTCIEPLALLFCGIRYIKMHNSPQGQHIKVISTDLNSPHGALSNGILQSTMPATETKNTRGVDATPSLGAYVTRFSLGIVGLTNRIIVVIGPLRKMADDKRL